jgi:hypothetical protein
LGVTVDPLVRVQKALETAGCNPHGQPWKCMTSCPVPGHGRGRGDRNPSLSVREGIDGRVLVYCFAGCSAEEIVRAIGLTMADLFPEGHSRGGRPAKPVPPARPGHLQGPFGQAIDYIAALAKLDQRALVSVMSRCFSCGAEGAWLRVDHDGATLDCPEGCDGGAVAGALAQMVAEHG